MIGNRDRSKPLPAQRGMLRGRSLDPADQPARVAGGGSGDSYSVRVCGRCRAVMQPDASGRERCPVCGRTRARS